MLTLTRPQLESIFADVMQDPARKLIFSAILDKATLSVQNVGPLLNAFATKLRAMYSSQTKIQAIKYAREQISTDQNRALVEAARAAGYSMTDGPARGEYAGSPNRVEYLSLAAGKKLVEDIFDGKTF